MFDHCRDFGELNDAYDAACKNAKPPRPVADDVMMARLQNGEAIPDDGYFDLLDEITASMKRRWSELKGEPWPE